MHVRILGCRGIPANHGGFEKFAEDLSLFLVARNHRVTAYCQVHPNEKAGEDEWNGVRRVLIPAGSNALGTVAFDWSAACHATTEHGVALTLGYNTGIFNFLYRLRRLPNVINMDGLEWKRKKWSRMERAWLWGNEWAGARAANYLVADHPEIKNHLLRHTPSEKITVIPYGARRVVAAPIEPVHRYGLTPKNYYLVVARPEPENSILEIVQAFSQRRRGSPLVVLGTYVPERIAYHREVMNAAGPEVRFLGAIHNQDKVESLRFHASAYLHGHTVGGTNPSLVESLAAGTPIIAHDNRFNRWVAGPRAKYFRGVEDLFETLESIESEPRQLLAMEAASRNQHRRFFEQNTILSAYEQLLLRAAYGDVASRLEDSATRPEVQVEMLRSGTEG